MHHNQILIHQLGIALKKQLQGFIFFDAFSVNKNELVLVFNKIDEWFSIKLLIEARTFFVQFYNYPLERKGSVYVLFEQLKNKVFETTYIHQNERSFRLCFGSNFSLVFKLYGSLANVLFFDGNELKMLFRPQIESDKHLLLSNFTKLENTEYQNIDIVKVGLYYSQNGFPVISNEFPNDESTQLFSSFFEAFNEFSRQYLGKYFYTEKRNKLIQQCESELKRWKPIEINATKALNFLQLNARNEQLGHIIMANLHLMKKGDEELNTLDFYTNNSIIIKLKVNLNPQENAQYYYKKARNQKSEELLLQNKISQAAEKIAINEAKLTCVLAAQNMKDLKAFELPTKKNNPKTDQRESYRQFEHLGYKILVGKSAANNDELTLKIAHKNDLWLHAKGVSGSHVVIKHQGNKPFPNEVITYAAQLAAYYSKLKGSAMVPVIFTPKKFVRKPKGAEPGQVLVEKEEVILVEPKL